jgi:predicted glycoside hydrolase/deacetylase ChbG (UPF0249 family)
MTVIAESALPEGFADLEIFVADWGRLDSAELRYLKRQESPAGELRAFYEAMIPRIGAILSHLDRHPVDKQLPPKEEALFRIALGFGEAAAAIEIHGQPRIAHVDAPHHVRVDWSDGTKSRHAEV